MAKKATTPTTPATVSELEAIAVKLDALATEAGALGEDNVSAAIGRAAKSARWFDKQRANRRKRVGSLVTSMKAKGLSDAEIVAALTK